jgi:hypothetical protein
VGLAHLEWIGPNDGGQQFTVNLGTNRWFRFAVGGQDTTRRYGMELLSEPTRVSSVEGPLPDRAMGRTVITIPDEAFDRDHRHVQVTSYRSQDLVSPSVSDVVAVPVHALGRRGPRPFEDLPAVALEGRGVTVPPCGRRRPPGGRRR